MKNLRAAGHGTLTIRRAREEFTATELGTVDKIRFFRDILEPYLRTNRLARWFVRTLDRIPEDPVEAAESQIVFEVHRPHGPPRKPGR